MISIWFSVALKLHSHDGYKKQAHLFFFFLSFCRFRATIVAFRGSQARGLIGAVVASLCQGHSNARSEPCLQPTPQLMAMPDP